MTRLYVADFGSLFGWKYFAHKDEEDGGLRGFEDWFRVFCREMTPTHFVCCFDAGHDRRKAIDPEYKIARKTKPKDEAMLDQLRRAPDFVASLGIPCLREGGEEADDIIASVVAQHASEDTEVVVVSSDKDLCAVVGEFCRLYDPRPGKDGECKFLDVDGVVRHLGVPPWRVADLLAVAGDSSDGIKGIKGIGTVQAVRAIQQTKSVAGLFRKAALGELVDLKPSTQRLFAEGREQFEHAMALVKLRVDVPVPRSMETFRLRKQVAA